MNAVFRPWVIAFIVLGLSLPVAAQDISLLAIMGQRASVMIGGRPTTLTVGETRSGIKLLGIQGDQISVEMDGKAQTLSMSKGAYRSAIEASPAGAPSARASVYNDGRGHFFARVSGAGASVRGLIDTGATFLSLSKPHADQLGIRSDKGIPIIMHTAQGRMQAMRVTATELRLENIPFYNVEVVVSPGNFPDVPLIGMSILNRLDIQREGDVMTLTKKY